MKPSLKRALLFGLLYALVGISVSVQLSIDPHTNRDEFPNHSGPAAFLAPALIWYLLIEIRQKTGVVRGAVAGVLGSVLAHVVC